MGWVVETFHGKVWSESLDASVPVKTVCVRGAGIVHPHACLAGWRDQKVTDDPLVHSLSMPTEAVPLTWR